MDDRLKSLETLESRSAESTERAGFALGQRLPENAVVGLSGPLGAGKSVFARGLARALGVPGPIPSPSFSVYLVHRGHRQIVHLDAYRLQGGGVDALMLHDILEPPWCLIIEWPELLGRELPPLDVEVQLSDEGHGIRRLHIRGIRLRSI